jgi:hypothetical protein
MHSANVTDTIRRSSRVPVTLPIAVTSLEPSAPFSEVCETLLVSAHGCSMFSPTRLDAGVPVQFRKREGRAATAHVVDCQPMGSGQHGWQLSARLDRPENFWDLEACPEDWKRLLEISSADTQLSRKGPAKNRDEKGQAHTGASLKLVSEKNQAQLTDYDLRAMIAAAVQPLQAEVAELKEKLTRGGAKRSQFEISLSHIPPEVEEKVELHLRQALGEQVLSQTRTQSEQVFEAAKEAIGKKIREAQGEFREHLIKELRTVEQQAQGLSEELAATVGQHFDVGVKQFQQQVSEAGTRIQGKSEDHLRTLHQRLSEEHESYRREMQKTQAAAASESSRLQSQVSSLGARIGELDDIACRLESGMDTRLTQMASDAISGARAQLEVAVDVVLKELGSRNAKELEAQLNEARGKLKTVQKGIEASVSELVKTEVAAGLLSFGQTMEALAEDSVGRWRVALARDLSSVAKILGQPFRLEGVSASTKTQDPAAD